MEQSNLQHWEDLARLHGTSADHYYDLEKLVRGETLMGSDERAALDRATQGRGVRGMDVMHLQCHIGCDAITLAREGARVTGVDFSPVALDRLKGLAELCRVAVSTVQADSRDLPQSLDNSFDLVYATIGVLCWIDDLKAWMGGVARVLRPGGTLVLVELHPLFTMIDQIEPLTFDFPYEFDGIHEYSGTGSYANRDADVAWTVSQFAHSVGEVVNAAIDAGLAITYLEEHTSMSFDPRDIAGPLTERDGRYRLRLGQGSPGPDRPEPAFPVPVLFTLLAQSPTGQ